jgi:iron complex transport system ATP-binding protein
VIEARALTLAYTSVVLEDVTLSVRTGELLAIVGPNGVGKSTLLRSLAGIQTPLRGTVSVDGEHIAHMAPQTRAKHVTLVEVDEVTVGEMTVREAVALGRLPYRPWWRWSQAANDEAIVAGALERTDLAAQADRPLEALSSGERQRVWVALALAQQAPNLLFDEPTSHLDLRHATRMLSLLRELASDGAAVVIVVHDLNLAAAHADRIALLGTGRMLACDVPEQVFVEDLLSTAYATPIVVRRIDGMLLVGPAAPPARRVLL